MAAGGIAIVVVLVVIGPVAVMLGGAIWSALFGFLVAEDADRRVEEPADAAA